MPEILILDRATIVEKYTHTEDKIFMTMGEATQLSHELATRISECVEKPELVIGVANGALLITKIISDDLNIPMKMMKIKRKATTAKELVTKIPWLLKIISRCYRIPWLNKTLVWLIDRLKILDTDGFSELERACQIQKKNIIIIDDAIETGQTLNVVRQALKQGNGNTMTTAVISWSNKYDSNAQHGIVPDIYITRKIQHFPWSGNSPSLQKYLHWLEANNLKLE